jgi:hypothetical protein
MPVIMALKKKPLLNLHSEESPSPTGGKYNVLCCKHCKWTITDTRRALELLDNCDAYTVISKSSNQPTKRQTTLQLGIQAIPRAKKQCNT